MVKEAETKVAPKPVQRRSDYQTRSKISDNVPVKKPTPPLTRKNSYRPKTGQTKPAAKPSSEANSTAKSQPIVTPAPSPPAPAVPNVTVDEVETTPLASLPGTVSYEEFSRIKTERDALIQQCIDLEVAKLHLEESARPITSKSCVSVGCQTEYVSPVSVSSSTQTMADVSHNNNLSWHDASVNNIIRKKNLKDRLTSSFSPHYQNFSGVSLPDFLKTVKSNGFNTFNRKSTVASIYCFLEEVDLALGFARKSNEKMLLSPGLSKILPGKPKSISMDCWFGLPTVTLPGLTLKVISGEENKKVLILEPRPNQFTEDIIAIVNFLDDHAKVETNLKLGIDFFENFEFCIVDLLSTVKFSSTLKFCFYNRGGRDMDYFIIDNPDVNISKPANVKIPEPTTAETKPIKDDSGDKELTRVSGNHDQCSKRLKYLEEKVSQLDLKLNNSARPISVSQNSQQLPAKLSPWCNQPPNRHSHEWLSDAEISKYFAYLQSTHEHADVVLVNPLVSSTLVSDDKDIAKQHLDALSVEDKNFIIFPVNSTNDHWSLLLYDRILNTFWHFDSLASHHDRLARVVAQSVNSYFGKTNATFSPVSCPQQNNGYDCGTFLLYFTHNILNKILRSVKWGSKWYFHNPQYYVSRIRSLVFAEGSILNVNKAANFKNQSIPLASPRKVLNNNRNNHFLAPIHASTKIF